MSADSRFDIFDGAPYYPIDCQLTTSSSVSRTPITKKIERRVKALRDSVPYLKDLAMSQENVIYCPPSQHFASKVMSFGAMTVSGITKSLSFVVPGLRPGTGWDDDPVIAAPAATSAQPPAKFTLPSISVSCEEGPFAVNFFELKCNATGEAESLQQSFSELNGEEGRSLPIPVWQERAATPEEIAVEREFAAREREYDDLYWEGVVATRQKQLSQMKSDAAAAATAKRVGASTVSGKPQQSSKARNGEKQPVVEPAPFARSGSVSSIAQSESSTVTNGTSASRKGSMPQMLRKGSGFGGGAVRKGSSGGSHPPRWNTSGRPENSFRREPSITGSLSSTTGMIAPYNVSGKSGPPSSSLPARLNGGREAKDVERLPSTFYPKVVKVTPGSLATIQEGSQQRKSDSAEVFDTAAVQGSSNGEDGLRALRRSSSPRHSPTMSPPHQHRAARSNSAERGGRSPSPNVIPAPLSFDGATSVPPSQPSRSAQNPCPAAIPVIPLHMNLPWPMPVTFLIRASEYPCTGGPETPVETVPLCSEALDAATNEEKGNFDSPKVVDQAPRSPSVRQSEASPRRPNGPASLSGEPTPVSATSATASPALTDHNSSPVLMRREGASKDVASPVLFHSLGRSPQSPNALPQSLGPIPLECNPSTSSSGESSDFNKTKSHSPLSTQRNSNAVQPSPKAGSPQQQAGGDVRPVVKAEVPATIAARKRHIDSVRNEKRSDASKCCLMC